MYACLFFSALICANIIRFNVSNVSHIVHRPLSTRRFVYAHVDLFFFYICTILWYQYANIELIHSSSAGWWFFFIWYERPYTDFNTNDKTRYTFWLAHFYDADSKCNLHSQFIELFIWLTNIWIKKNAAYKMLSLQSNTKKSLLFIFFWLQ